MAEHGGGRGTSATLSLNSAEGRRDWRIPEEAPVAFVYNGRNYAVMLATPDALQDFAIGFSLTERVVDTPADILDVDVRELPIGAELRLRIAPDVLERLDVRQQRRNLVGRAGCGLCGLENAETFFETLPPVAETPMLVDAAALAKAGATFDGLQPLNQRTRTVHGAAWAGPGGEIAL
ncbi:MAG: formate dehydrogenase accessory sulfurtransferase FdhD, partial [Pseudomonadota bacterium]